MQTSLDGFAGAAWQERNWGDNPRRDGDLRRDVNLIFDSVGAILLSRPMSEGGYLAHWTFTCPASLAGAWTWPAWLRARKGVYWAGPWSGTACNGPEPAGARCSWKPAPRATSRSRSPSASRSSASSKRRTTGP